MLIPVLTTALKTYPELRITVVTKNFNKPLFQGIERLHIQIADVYGGHKGVFGLYRLAKTLKKQEITTVADMHQVLRSKLLRGFLWTMGCKLAVINKGRSKKRALTKATGKTWEPLITTHSRYADVLAKLGYPIDLNQYEPLKRQRIPKPALQLVGDWKGKLLGIAPFAAFPAKTYGMQQMRKVLDRINAQGNIKAFLFGAPSERERLSELASGLNMVTPLAGVLDFKKELAFISNLDLMMAMDSGNGHLAANYGVPVLTLWGVTHPYLGFAPFGQGSENWLTPDLKKYSKIPTSVYGKNNPEGYDEAINTIPAAQVVAKINQLL